MVPQTVLGIAWGPKNLYLLCRITSKMMLSRLSVSSLIIHVQRREKGAVGFGWLQLRKPSSIFDEQRFVPIKRGREWNRSQLEHLVTRYLPN